MASKSEFEEQAETSRSLPRSSVKGMIRRLIAQARDERARPASRAPAPDAEPKKVIFDTEVDGVRYVLVREDNSSAREFGLSPREQEIVRMIAKGYPNKMIATVLEISSWTVGTHLRRIFAKVGVNTRAALVAATSHFQGFEPKVPAGLPKIPVVFKQ